MNLRSTYLGQGVQEMHIGLLIRPHKAATWTRKKRGGQCGDTIYGIVLSVENG
jgi:hypothetical protein